MNDVIKAMSERCSVRKFSDQEVSKESLQILLEAAACAPSAHNYQPWRMIVVEDNEAKEKLHQCSERNWFKHAPLYIIMCADHRESWKRELDGKDHADVDIAIATQQICLAAHSIGLGSCWVCAFDAARCKELFELPSYIEPIALLPIGYPLNASKEVVKNRRPLEEIVFYNRYKE